MQVLEDVDLERLRDRSLRYNSTRVVQQLERDGGWA